MPLTRWPLCDRQSWPGSLSVRWTRTRLSIAGLWRWLPAPSEWAEHRSGNWSVHLLSLRRWPYRWLSPAGGRPPTYRQLHRPSCQTDETALEAYSWTGSRSSRSRHEESLLRNFRSARPTSTRLRRSAWHGRTSAPTNRLHWRITSRSNSLHSRWYLRHIAHERNSTKPLQTEWQSEIKSDQIYLSIAHLQRLLCARCIYKITRNLS